MDKKVLKPKKASMKRPLKTLIDISSCSNSTNPGSQCTTECSQVGFQNDAFGLSKFRLGKLRAPS